MSEQIERRELLKARLIRHIESAVWQMDADNPRHDGFLHITRGSLDFVRAYTLAKVPLFELSTEDCCRFITAIKAVELPPHENTWHADEVSLALHTFRAALTDAVKNV